MNHYLVKWSLLGFLPRLAASWAAFLALAVIGALTTGGYSINEAVLLLPWFIFDTAPWAFAISAASWASKFRVQIQTWQNLGMSPGRVFIPLAFTSLACATLLFPLAYSWAPHASRPLNGDPQNTVSAYMPDHSLWLAQKEAGHWKVIADVSKNKEHLSIFIQVAAAHTAVPSDAPSQNQLESMASPPRSLDLGLALGSPDIKRRGEGMLRLEGLLAIPCLAFLAFLVGCRRTASISLLSGAGMALLHALAREVIRAFI